MVMSSSSIVAGFRPHIGSEVGGGTCFGVIPESQWPALPAQQGIVLEELKEALAIGSKVVKNDAATKKHKRHNASLAGRWYIL